MSNPYYNNTETLIPTAKARASDVEAKFDAVGAGFDAIDVVLDTKAPANSPALTGTPTAPTASPGTNTTQIATTAFVQQQAFSSTLPDQTGNSGKFLKTNGITASWDTTGIGTGSVTSVAMSVPAFLSVAGSPITASGTLAVDFSGSALPAANGGTGNITYTVGDILYASGATALAKLSAVATGNVLLSGGVGLAPSWGKVSLSGTQHVTGTLPVGNGGTGATTLTGLVKGNGTGAFTAATAGTDYAAPGQTFYIGTTQVAINRASGSLTLDGIVLSSPNIGAPSAGTLTNCTGLPPSGVTGTAAVLGANTFTGDQTLGNNNLKTVKTVGFNGEVDNGNSGAAKTITLATGQKQKVTLTANTTLTISTTGATVGSYQLRLIQDGTGSRSVTWSGLSSSRWLNSASAPLINSTASSETIVTIFFDGTTMTQSLAKVGAF